MAAAACAHKCGSGDSCLLTHRVALSSGDLALAARTRGAAPQGARRGARYWARRIPGACVCVCAGCGALRHAWECTLGGIGPRRAAICRDLRIKSTAAGANPSGRGPRAAAGAGAGRRGPAPDSAPAAGGRRPATRGARAPRLWSRAGRTGFCRWPLGRVYLRSRRGAGGPPTNYRRAPPPRHAARESGARAARRTRGGRRRALNTFSCLPLGSVAAGAGCGAMLFSKERAHALTSRLPAPCQCPVKFARACSARHAPAPRRTPQPGGARERGRRGAAGGRPRDPQSAARSRPPRARARAGPGVRRACARGGSKFGRATAVTPCAP